MEIKDGAVIITDEEKQILSSDLGKKFLTENNLVVEREVKQELNDDIVTNYINKNQSLKDKIYNDNAIKFLKSKLGKDVDIQDLGKEIVTKSDYDNLKEQAIKNAVVLGLKGVSKHHNLLAKDIDYSKLGFENGELTGFDDVLKDLQTRYTDLFNNDVTKNTTPPKLPGNNETVKKMTYEDFIKLSKEERKKVSDEDLNRMLRGE